MSGLPAYGAVGGAIVEFALVLTILAVVFAVWRRERPRTTTENKTLDEQDSL